MKIAFYNQMFSLDGRSFWSNVFGHWSVHFQSDFNKIKRRTDLKRTIGTVSKVNADIIGVCEILESQFQSLQEQMKTLGYSFSNYTRGHKLSHFVDFVGVYYLCIR